VNLHPATEADLDEIAAMQRACPEASQWDPRTYLGYTCLVAREGPAAAGFLVARQTAPGEHEILNLGVVPSSRRKGVAKALLFHLISTGSGSWFLEVRASNSAALGLYKDFGFQQVGERKEYYKNPAESAIVMRIIS
jgi:ribosomal-protein-alanine N-acetyltransferase